MKASTVQAVGITVGAVVAAWLVVPALTRNARPASRTVGEGIVGLWRELRRTGHRWQEELEDLVAEARRLHGQSHKEI